MLWLFAPPPQAIENDADVIVIDDVESPPSKQVLRERFYRSEEWIKARDLCLATKGRVCVGCGATKLIQVDHIKPRSKFPELALDQSNLRPFCWPCNKAKAARVLV